MSNSGNNLIVHNGFVLFFLIAAIILFVSPVFSEVTVDTSNAVILPEGIVGESFYAGKSDLVINVSPPDGYISKDDTGELIDICCRKIWEDDDNLAGKRPERVTVFLDRKSTRLNSSHPTTSRMPSCA